MVGELTDRLFRGDVTALVSHLLSEHEIDPAELEELSRRIAEREAETASDAAADPAVDPEEEPR